MDIISKAPFYGSIQRYRLRRKYQLLGITAKDKRAIRLGGKGRRSWNVKVIRKLKLGFRILSPIKILAKLRNAFNNLLGSNQAGNVGCLNMGSVCDQKRLEKGNVAKVHVVDEFESKLVFEIYRRLKDSRELAAK
ncbi:hypothetical protein ACHQM5_005629 [Ranunculus cassubicifolius]